MNANKLFQVSLMACATTLLACGCVPHKVGPAPATGPAIESSTNCPVDDLVDLWEVGPPDAGINILEGDTYRIEKKTDGGTDKYFLVLGKIMSDRQHWKDQKKPAAFELTKKSLTGAPNCFFLCADGIVGRGGFFSVMQQQHIIRFLPPTNNRSDIEYAHKEGANTCDQLDVHGGRAHGQN